MQVRLWQSFSCNNSSSHYVVATFESGAAAEAVAATLDDQFESVADDEDFYLWSSDEPPQVFVEGQTIVVYHSYCGGLYEGFNLPGSATYESEEGTPQLTVMLRVRDDEMGAQRIAELANFFAKRGKEPDTSEWGMAPWGGELPYADATDDVAWWTDGTCAGFHIPFDDVDQLRGYLKRDGFESYELLLCDSEVRAKLEVLADASACPECQSERFKLVAADDAVPEDQMACADCGGMFGLTTLALQSPRARLDDDRLMLVRGTGGVLFATSWDKAIWRRTDSWEKVDTTDQRVAGLLVTKDLVLVTGERALLRVSRDGGGSWTTSPTPDAEPIWAAATTPGGTLFAVGNRGTLLRSTDAARSWTQISATKFDLLDIAAVSDDVLFACGRFGKILRSLDGGESWDVTQAPVETPLCRIAARSATSAVIVGDRNVILETSDGATWRKHLFESSVGDIEDVAMGSRGSMFAVTSQGYVLASADGWQPIGDSLGKHLRGVCISDGSLFVVGAGGTVRRIDAADIDAESAVRCRHAKFGEGVVVDDEGTGETRKVTVDFEVGRKVLQARFLDFDD